MRECCKNFFDINGLQGDMNEPMQFCPYCGEQLTDREFEYYNERMGRIMIKTGPIDSQILEQLKSLGDVIEKLKETNTALTKKLGPVLHGSIPSSSSSVNTEYAEKLCPLAKDLFYHIRDIQEVTSALHVTLQRVQL